MKTKLSLLCFSGLLLFAAGCSTVDSRIAKNRTAFSSWPPPVQDKVVAGQIAVGFTPEQVRVALGEPYWRWSRTTGDGTSQIWSYGYSYYGGPRYGFGFGFAGYGRRRAYGLGVHALGPGYYGSYSEERRVIFDPSGHVSQIESVTP